MRRDKGMGSLNLLCAVVLICLAATICSSGCIRMLQKNPDSAQMINDSPQNSTGMSAPSGSPGGTIDSLHQVPITEMTPAKSEVVTEVTPFLTPDPYPIIHGTRINSTPLDNPLDRNPEFEKTYTLGGNAVGLMVNVAEGPLYIVYAVTPKYDCMESPESCRGNLAASVNRPFMTITVRDNYTHEIVAEDGYGREFSSDTGNYQFTITSTDPATGETTTTTTSPGPRYIEIYKEGVYQVTIEGNYLDVDMKILTGASPSKLDIGNGDSSASTSSSQAESSTGNPWNQ